LTTTIRQLTEVRTPRSLKIEQMIYENSPERIQLCTCSLRN